jgi:hypothetical protein
VTQVLTWLGAATFSSNSSKKSLGGIPNTIVKHSYVCDLLRLA